MKYINLKRIVLILALVFSFGSLEAQNICFGSVKTYNVDTTDGTEGTPGSTYAWTVPTSGFAGTITSTTTSGNEVNIDWGTTPPGTYTIQVIETANDCPGDPKTAQVTILPELLQPDVTLASSSVCEGTTINFELTHGTPNSNVIYSFDGGTTTSTITLDGTGAANIAADTASAGTVTLTLISSEYTTAPECTNTFTANNTFDLTVNALPSMATITPTSTAVCAGDNAIFTVNGGNDDIVSYKVNNGSIETITLDATTGVGTITVPTSDSSGDITVELIQSENTSGCTASYSVLSTITVNALPTAPTVMASASAVCQDDAAHFTISGSEGDSVTYDINGTSTTVVIPAGGSIDINVNTAISGTNTLNVTSVSNGNNCTLNVTGVSATLTVNNTPTTSDINFVN